MFIIQDVMFFPHGQKKKNCAKKKNTRKEQI